jgi:hypothetical protein
MLNRNFADATARIAAMHKPKFEAVQTPDLGMQFAQAMRAYQDKKEYDEQEANKTSLVEAIKGGNPEEIRAAAAKYDADLGLQYFMNDQAKAQDFERQKELANYNHALDMKKQEALYKLKGDLDLINGGYGTAAQRNIAYLQGLGHSPEEAAAMVFSGQNPSFGQIYPNLGSAGSKKTDQELGKNYAADLDEYNNMVSKMPELEDTVNKLMELSPKATYTMIGRLRNAAKKELGQGSTEGGVAREEYDSIISNQVLPLMRDTFGAQFTQKEGETLRATLGDVNKTPEEKEAALRSFIEQKKNSIESKYRKLKSYEQGFGAKAYNSTPTDEEAFGDI